MENELNDLSGSEWLYWTGTLYPTNYPPDPTHALRKVHGAMKPPGLMAEIVSFFTKKGELVLDPLPGWRHFARARVGVRPWGLIGPLVAVYRRIQGSLPGAGPVRGRSSISADVDRRLLELLALPGRPLPSSRTRPMVANTGLASRGDELCHVPQARRTLCQVLPILCFDGTVWREAYRLLPKDLLGHAHR